MGNACNCERGLVDGPDLNLRPLKKDLSPLSNFSLPEPYPALLKTLPPIAPIPNLDPHFYQLSPHHIYHGSWTLEGHPTGSGVIYYPERGVYQGQVEEGIPKGNGAFISKQSEVYKGEFDGLGVITGTMTDSEGVEVQGVFRDLYIEGEGTEKWKNGTTYIGGYRRGVKFGKGKMVWLDEQNKPNEVYEGEFMDNTFNGIGNYNWSNKRKYTGEWKDGKMHGKGVFEWKDGRVYNGEFFDDLKQGFGEFKWVDGRIWRGNWEKGLKHGIGLQVDSSGGNQVGEWKEDKRVRWLEGDEAKEAMGRLKKVKKTE